MGQVVATWTDGNGDWNTPSNWSTGVVPDSNTNVFITDGTSSVTLNTVGSPTLALASAANLQIGSGNTLTAGGLTVNGPQILNYGQFVIIGGPPLDIGATTVLQGAGTLTLAGGNIFGNGQQGTPSLINESTIQGTGNIELGAIVNTGGTINANITGQPLGVVFNGLLVNAGGTLEATNGGTLSLAFTSFLDNKNGTIAAIGTGSAVQITNGTTIQGGTLTTAAGAIPLSPSGQIILDGATQGALTLSSGSTYKVVQDTTTGVLGTIINNGNIQLIGGNLNITADTTLRGTGVVTLGTDGNGFGIGQITGGQFATLTNQSTIQGAGIFSGPGNIINAAGGSIDANVAGQVIALPLLNLSNTGGTLEATNGGILALDYTHEINNKNGVIASIGAGSLVNFNSGSRIDGGTLTTAGGGILGPLNSAGFGIFLDGSTQGPLTLSTGSTWTSTTASTNFLGGTYINNGNMLFGGGLPSDVIYASMLISGDTLLQGAGTVTLTPNTSGVATIGASGSATLTNQSTIQGAGTIGGGSALALINQGLIDANVAGQTLTLSPSSLQNSGTLQVESGSTMVLSVGSGVTSNTGGTINVNPGGTLNNIGTLNNTSGAILNSGGILNSTGGMLYFDSSSRLNNTGTINVTGPGGLVADGGINNEGVISLDNSNLVAGGYSGRFYPASLQLQNGSVGVILGAVTGSDNGGQIVISNSSLTVIGTFGMETTNVNQGTLRIQGNVEQPDGGLLNLQMGSTALVTGNFGGYAQQTTIDDSTLIVQGNYGSEKISQVHLTNGAILSVGGNLDVGAGTAVFEANSGSSISVSGNFSNDGSRVFLNDSLVKVSGSFTNNDIGMVSIGSGTLLSATSYSQIAQDGTTRTDISGTLSTHSYNQSGGTTTIENGGILRTDTFLATGGTVTVNGLLDPTAVEIDSGAILQGHGTIIGNVAIGGTLMTGAPGTPGTLTLLGNYEQFGNGTFDEQIGAHSSSFFNITGDAALDFNSMLTITLLDGYDPLGQTFGIMDYGSLVGQFSNGSSFWQGGFLWEISYGQHEIDVTAVSAPEPSSLLLLFIGLAALAVYAQRKMRQATDLA